MLRAEALTLRRGAREVLRDVSICLFEREILAVVGPNGAGKSSLLATLAGDLIASSGTLSLRERAIASFGPQELAQARSVLLQDSRVAFPFSVRDVVAMGRAPWRRTAVAADDELQVAAAMAAVDVSALAERNVMTLSGGEAARVALARVLTQQTPLLLLDEPTAALDPHHQEQVFAHLRRLADAGAAILVIVHDLNIAAAFADRVAVLAGGRITAAGPVLDVLTEENLSSAYGHPIEILRHPRTGGVLVLPRR